MGQLASMTGFARHDGAHGAHSWHWELRSVNGRGLDLRIRVPNGFSSVEQEVRKRAAKRLVRGNFQISLNTHRDAGETRILLNTDAFQQVFEAAQKAAELAGSEVPGVEHLIGLRGVLDAGEPEQSDEDKAAFEKAVLASFDQALASVVEMRDGEGNALGQMLGDALTAIQSELDGIVAAPARTSEALQARLREQLGKLVDDAEDTIDPNRLHQELALLLTKADISEELTRLEAHIIAVRELLDAGGACGRRLDFLAQELNREANTICSKSHDVTITKHGLELKVLIDQIREQVQNIE